MTQIHIFLLIIHASFYRFFTSDYSNYSFWETDLYFKPKKFPALTTSLFTGAVILYGEKMWHLKMTDKKLVLNCIWNSVNSVEYSIDIRLKITHSAALIDSWNKGDGVRQYLLPGIPDFRILFSFFSSYLKATGL